MSLSYLTHAGNSLPEASDRLSGLGGWLGLTCGVLGGWHNTNETSSYAVLLHAIQMVHPAASCPRCCCLPPRGALEAAGRGLWQPKEEVIEQLRRLYGEMDSELEGVR